MPESPVLPDYIPQTPQPEPGNIRPGRRPIRSAGVSFGSLQIADGKPLPIPYGEVMLDGLVGALAAPTATVTGSFFYCIGEIDGIAEVYLPDKPGSVWSEGAHGSSQIIGFPEAPTLEYLRLTQYHGTKTQIVDPTLAANFPGYTDDNVYRESGQEVGQVYIAFQQKFGGSVNLQVPRIVVRGLRVWDPRLSGGAGGLAYSDNPALWLADFLIAPYGAGLQIDWDSVTVVADRADELVNGKKRWWGGCAITEDAGIEQHIERLRAIAGCMVRIEGSTVFLVPNAPAPSVFTFTSDKIVAGSLRFGHKDQRNLPTRIVVEYTQRSRGGLDLVPWDTGRAIYEPDPTAPRRSTKVDLRDAQSHEVAYRYAVQEYRLRHVDRWACSFKSRDQAAAAYQGEVVTVQHRDLIGASMAFRIVRVRQSRGRSGTIYDIDLTSYDGSVYSDDDVVDPLPQLPTNVDPDAPPAITTLAAEEIIGPDQTGSIRSRVEIVFSPVEYPYLSHYRVKLVGPGVKFTWDVQPSAKDIITTSPDLSNVEISDTVVGELFVAKVSSVSRSGGVSAAKRATVRVLSRYAPPPDVSTFISLAHVQGQTFIVIQPVVDIGEMRYIARYSPGVDSGWELALPVNDVPVYDNQIIHYGFADETNEEIWYYVKAVDDTGVESVNALKGRVTTDPQLPDEFREVAFMFDYPDVIGGHDFFVYGESDFRGTFGADVTWADRLGTTAVPARLLTAPWYDGTGITPADSQPWPQGDLLAFDLGTESVRRVAADGEHHTYRSGSGEVTDIVVPIRPYVDSDLYGPFVGPEAGNITRSMRRATFWSQNTLTPLAKAEYAEIKMPVTVVARKILHDQGGNVFDLTQADLPYQVTFDDPYSTEPLLQATHVSDKSNNVFAINNLTAEGFEFDRISGGGAVTWSLSWRAIGN